MAAVGLPCWTPGVWSVTLWKEHVWREDAVVVPGALTPEQILRLRGAQGRKRPAPHVDDPTPPQEPVLRSVERPFPVVGDVAHTDRAGLLGRLTPAVAQVTSALAAADAMRRQALAEEEELALLLLLLEVL